MKKFKYKTKNGDVVEILYDKYFKTFECYDYIYHINVDNQFVNELFKYTKKLEKYLEKNF